MADGLHRLHLVVPPGDVLPGRYVLQGLGDVGGLLLLPLGLAFFWNLLQRREELRKGELNDAKNY